MNEEYELCSKTDGNCSVEEILEKHWTIDDFKAMLEESVNVLTQTLLGHTDHPVFPQYHTYNPYREKQAWKQP